MSRVDRCLKSSYNDIYIYSICFIHSFIRSFSGLKKIDNALYEEFEKCDFGSDTINTLQLCAMGQPVDKHGYYHVDHSALFGKIYHFKNIYNIVSRI